MSDATPGSALALEDLVRRDHGVWEACAPSYEDRIVHGHPEVRAYLGFEEDLLDRLLRFLTRDRGREIVLHDIGCGSGRLHLRYGRHLLPNRTQRGEPTLSTQLRAVHGLDFSSQMLALARRKLQAAGLEELLGSRLHLTEGSAFDLPPLPTAPLPVAVALCNTIGVMQGPSGAGRLFAALRRAVGDGGIAMVSCYRREAVEDFALGNYESTQDVSGQPRWLTPTDFAGEGFLQVPRRYKCAGDRDPAVVVDVFDQAGNLVKAGHVLVRHPAATQETVRSGHIKTHSDYESRWYGFDQLELWIAEHWRGVRTHHLKGTQLDTLRAGAVQLAFLDGSGLLGDFLADLAHPPS